MKLPLQDSPIEVNGYYATAQYVHGKKLINNHVSKYNIGQFSALGTEENPETIDFLKARGADAVITRATNNVLINLGASYFIPKKLT